MTLAFNSIEYAVFLAAVVAVYWLLPRPWRRGCLLVASYAFYATFDWRFTPLLAATTAVHLVAGRRIAATDRRTTRRGWLAVAIAFTALVLGFFKYAGWLDVLFSRLFGLDHDLLTVALPIGISYYTFHTLSYTVDIYRREQEPTGDLVGFALFVAYFPQLLSGPLTRARRMLPQFGDLPRRASPVQTVEGLELILIGLFQKVALADALAPVTAAAFADTSSAPAPDQNVGVLVLTAMAGMAQLVLDLTGYSNIARGTSKLLGIELPHNFRQPLTRSRNLQDYWRRHHLTLMAWLRDYVFRPLRDRFGTGRRAAFLIVVAVFAFSGVWHGSSAGWVVWGVLMGLGVATETAVLRGLDRRRRARPDAAGSPAPRRSGLRQLRASVLCLAWLGLCAVFIRSPSLAAAASYFGGLSRFRWTAPDWDVLGTFAYVTAAVILLDRREARMERTEGTADPPTPARVLLWSGLVLGLVVFSGTAGRPFVYFGF